MILPEDVANFEKQRRRRFGGRVKMHQGSPVNPDGGRGVRRDCPKCGRTGMTGTEYAFHPCAVRAAYLKRKRRLAREKRRDA
jgi:hypothetical protein